MTVEFELDELRGALRNALTRQVVTGLLGTEFSRIIEKHKEAAIEELQQLSEKFVIHVLTSPDSMVTKVKITTPDCPAP